MFFTREQLERLAENLHTVTGIKFTVDASKGDLTGPYALTMEQDTLLERLRKKENHPEEGLPCMKGTSPVRIPGNFLTETIMHEIAFKASDEAKRVARLKESAPYLEKASGIKFEFDYSNKILISKRKPASSYPIVLNALQSSDGLEMSVLEDGLGGTIAVFDASPGIVSQFAAMMDKFKKDNKITDAKGR